jgi:thiol-disulfide isomerase/thioredoxin
VNRRGLLAAVAGLGLTGGAAYVSLDGLNRPDGGADGGLASPEQTETGSDSGGGALPMTVETLDAPGSTAGTQTIPVPGTPTVVDLFATWCVPCKSQMDALAAVHESHGEDAAFVSVTNEQFGGGFSREDVRNWWTENDGAWTVGHDPGSKLFRALQANGLPFLAILNASGTVVWTHRGTASRDVLEREVQAVIDG